MPCVETGSGGSAPDRPFLKTGRPPVTIAFRLLDRINDRGWIMPVG